MGNSLPDNDLISRLRAGDRRAFKEIYLFFYTGIYLFAESLVKNDLEAGDIVSERFVKLWNLRQDFEQAHAVRAFLYLSTRNACIDHLRARKRRAASHEEIRYLSKEEEGWLEREMIQAEILREIHRQVEDLPPRCRQVFQLLFFKGKKAREVAEQLGIRPSTVQVHRSKALKLLRNVLLRKFAGG